MGRCFALIIGTIMITAFASQAHAQSISYSVAVPGGRESPEVNNYLSARYDHLLQVSRRFRTYRMWKECHTVNFPPLHDECIASFDQYEPVLPEYARASGAMVSERL